MKRREPVSQREYARRRGLRPSTVWARTAAGGGPVPTHGRHKQVDPAEADAAWEGYREGCGRGGRPEVAGPREADAFRRARTAKMVATAGREALELRRRKAALLDRAMVLGKVHGFARHMEASWRHWPRRVAAELAAKVDCNSVALAVALEAAVAAHLDELDGVGLEL